MKRTLLVSISLILICMSIIIGTTWALFTDTQEVSNHLKAGDLDVTLTRVGLTKTTLNKEGYLVTLAKDETPKDFSKATSENIFDLATNPDREVTELIVPGSKFVADMEIKNRSDVAFGYWVEIVCTDKTKGEDLAKQLKVTVKTNSSKSDFVGNGLVVRGASNGYVGELAVGEKDEFTVTVEFLDSAVKDNNISSNNLAKNEELKFDLVVHAVQLTTPKS
ncbi:MAG: SipW-dependent-type signal peptide-containing protein [Clostridia bacterium]|nr:SipW-dependent-type signal peptide-containing protein [Clostridia bacterium]